MIGRGAGLCSPAGVAAHVATWPYDAHTFAPIMTCIFCKIAAGDIPAEKVVENEHAFAFLDINPLARGHVLVVPRTHRERVADMLPAEAHAVMELTQSVLRRQQKALGTPGATVAVNDGRAAGQEVPHVHVHLVPRNEGDDIGPIHRLFAGKAPELGKGELQELGAQLRG